MTMRARNASALLPCYNHATFFLRDACHTYWRPECSSARQSAFKNDVIKNEARGDQQVIAALLLLRNRCCGCVSFRRDELYPIKAVANLFYNIQYSHVIQDA